MTDEPIGKSPVPVRAAPPIPVRPAPSPPSDLKQLALVPSRPAPSRPNPTRVAPPPPHQPAALGDSSLPYSLLFLHVRYLYNIIKNCKSLNMSQLAYHGSQLLWAPVRFCS